jgi:hypothetical protein
MKKERQKNTLGFATPIALAWALLLSSAPASAERGVPVPVGISDDCFAKAKQIIETIVASENYLAGDEEGAGYQVNAPKLPDVLPTQKKIKIKRVTVTGTFPEQPSIQVVLAPTWKKNGSGWTTSECPLLKVDILRD